MWMSCTHIECIVEGRGREAGIPCHVEAWAQLHSKSLGANCLITVKLSAKHLYLKIF